MAQTCCRCRSPVDLLVVDDNSSDGTGKIADELAAKHPQIHVLHEQKKTAWAGPTLPDSNGRWKAAMNSSSKWTAIFRTTRTKSPIFSRPPQGRRPRARLALFRRRARLELAAQTAAVEPLRRHLRLGHHRHAFHRPDGRLQMLPPPRAPVRPFRRCKSDGYSFQIELTHRLWRDGFKIAEVPITFTDRIEGRSKISRDIIIEAFRMVWRLWLQNGLRRWPRKRKGYPVKADCLPGLPLDKSVRFIPSIKNDYEYKLVQKFVRRRAGRLFSPLPFFADMPKVGDTAPLFTGQDQDGII